MAACPMAAERVPNNIAPNMPAAVGIDNRLEASAALNKCRWVICEISCATTDASSLSASVIKINPELTPI